MLEYIDSHSTSIDEELKYQLEVAISPNPASGFFMVDLPSISNRNCRLEIYNLTGRLVQQENFSGSKIEVSTNTLPEGIYILRFIADEKQAIRKMIIQQ
jgi:hypothetical protein